MPVGILMPDLVHAQRYNYRGKSGLHNLSYNNGNSCTLFPIRQKGDVPYGAAS
jgi:hypothetical protein